MIDSLDDSSRPNGGGLRHKAHTHHHYPQNRQRLHSAIILCLLLALLPCLAWGKTSRILVIHSYHQDYPWTSGQYQGFIQTINAQLGHSALIETEHLDTKRLNPSQDYLRFFAEYLAKKYQDVRFDALYVTDDNALLMSVEHLPEPLNRVPVFYSGINDLSVEKRLDPRQYAGVLERNDLSTNLMLVTQLAPNSQQLCVIGDSSRTTRLIQQEARAALAKQAQIHPLFISEDNIAGLEQALRECTNRPILLTSVGALKDQDGNVITLEQTLNLIASATSSAVISMEDSYVRSGVLGGYVTSGPQQGRSAAKLMLQYLRGRPMQQLNQTAHSPNTYLFDDQILHKLGLTLPAKIRPLAQLLNQRPDFYTRHRRGIVAALAVIATSLVLLLILYVIQLSRRNKLLHQQSLQIERQHRLLEESEEKYRLLFERSDDPMLVFVENEFVMANDATARLLGYANSHQVLSLHPADLSPQNQPDGQASSTKSQHMIDTAHAKGYHRFEWMHQKRDGTPVMIEVTLTRIPYAGQNALFCVWRDLTERNLDKQRLLEKTTYLNSVLSSSVNVGFIATDQALDITFHNQRAAEIFGTSPQELAGKNLSDLHSNQCGIPKEHFIQKLQMARDTGEQRFSMTPQREDGKRYIDARISPILTAEQELAGYMLMAEDVSKQYQAEQLIKRQAGYDSLTDLPNRRTLLERLTQELANSKRHHHFGALLFLDLDNFKHINDSLGHPMGDALLQHVGQLMLDIMRSEDTVARLGGDEFVILLSETAHSLEHAMSKAQGVATKLLKAITQPVVINDYELRAHTSIGITLFPQGDESADDVLRQADTALYKAKEAGRNTYMFFSPEMQAQSERRISLVNSLSQAIEQEQFEVYLQPQIGIDNTLYGAEALVRWRHPEKGMIPPDEFIPLAEETGLIDAISRSVIQQTIEAQNRWNESYPDHALPHVSINLSAKQFDQTDFAENMIQTLKELNADTTRLTLELTESMLLGKVEQTAEKMMKLKALGVRFSVDDFGTGYSSLAYLKRLPLDEIKIDRSFVRDIPYDSNDAALVEMMISLSEQLNFDVVAEGVEHEAALRFLQKKKCKALQGYYFSKPIPIPEFEQIYIANLNSVYL